MVLDTELNHVNYKKKPETKEVVERIEDFIEDIKDDGKRNYSHDPKRKSPGRKRKFLK